MIGKIRGLFESSIGKRNWVATELGDGLVRVAGTCVINSDPVEYTVSADGLKAYLASEDSPRGIKIQDALPEASADAREFVKTGIGPKGWEQLFSKKE